MAVVPVCRVIDVFASITPARCEPAPVVTAPVVTHTMFFANAPPARTIFLPAASDIVPDTWKIQAVKNIRVGSAVSGTCIYGRGSSLSVAPPTMVMSLPMLTALLHL